MSERSQRATVRGTSFRKSVLCMCASILSPAIIAELLFKFCPTRWHPKLTLYVGLRARICNDCWGDKSASLASTLINLLTALSELCMSMTRRTVIGSAITKTSNASYCMRAYIFRYECSSLILRTWSRRRKKYRLRNGSLFLSRAKRNG